MNIRLEQPKDYREVENLTREAFWNVYRPGCVEHYVLNQYRTNPDFIPELDFVMEEDGRIIGHVMYSKAELTLEDGKKFPIWTFGPISIHTDYKRKGYGLTLLNYSMEKAREMGIGALCMEGKIGFYKNSGFDLASKLHIHYHGEPKDAEVPYFLAKELIPGYLKDIEGTYCTPKGYFVADENPEEFEAYESTFPEKEKDFNADQLPQFCQSCGMPLTCKNDCGTNADGSTSFDYCRYCIKDGAFTGDFTMEQMIDYCSAFVEQYNTNTGQNLTCYEYKEVLRNFFPSLKRWNLPADAIPHADHPMKKVLIDEVNALGIPELHIDNLYVLQGSFINQPYTIGDNTFQVFDDNATYLGNQVLKKDGRCYGIACNEKYIVISEYGKDGTDAVLVMIKRR